MNIPYTYLIGWPELNLWYYGVRYARNCHPDEFWVSYFTSSANVHLTVAKYGDPSVKQIRKLFDNDIDARKWERRVLKRLKVVSKDMWINGNDGTAFDPACRARGDNHHMRKPGGSDYMKGDNNVMRRPEVAKKFSGSNHWFNRDPEGLKNFCGENSPLKKDPKLAKACSNRMKKNNPMKDPVVIAQILKRNAEKKLQKEN